MKNQTLNKFKNLKGFTLIELIIIVAILVILIAIAVPAIRIFMGGSDLENSAEEIINTLRFAQNKTIASEGASRWGVYFNNSASPHRYILFKGATYASRTPAFDVIHNLPITLEIYEIDLAGGNEVVFERVTGAATRFGKISLRVKNDLAKTKTIYIEDSGLVGENLPVIPSDVSRSKDSRHVHFNYSRLIDTASETLTLTFDGSVTKNILIKDNLQGGQIYWEGEVDVGGENQKIKIHTHNLNSPTTQFCIHRDRRYNDKALTVTIDDDGSGSLIDYTADGQESRGTSINLTPGGEGDPQRQ